MCVILMAIAGLAQPQTVLVLGDSIGAGYGLPDPDQGWVSLLQKRLAPQGWQVVNASVSGATTSDGLRSLGSLLGKHRPYITLVELGGNDGLRGTPIGNIRANLASIIDKTKKTGSKVLLIGITLPPNYGRRHIQRFEKIYDDLAAQQDVIMVSFARTQAGTNPAYLQFDRIHPNTAAQPILLEAVWEKLAPLLYLQ